MTRVRALGAFLYDFVVGDDPLVAVVVVLGLGLTALIAGQGIAAWWVMPPTVIAALGLSLYRAGPGARPDDERDA